MNSNRWNYIFLCSLLCMSSVMMAMEVIDDEDSREKDFLAVQIAEHEPKKPVLEISKIHEHHYCFLKFNDGCQFPIDDAIADSINAKNFNLLVGCDELTGHNDLIFDVVLDEDTICLLKKQLQERDNGPGIRTITSENNFRMLSEMQGKKVLPVQPAFGNSLYYGVSMMAGTLMLLAVMYQLVKHYSV